MKQNDIAKRYLLVALPCENYFLSIPHSLVDVDFQNRLITDLKKPSWRKQAAEKFFYHRSSKDNSDFWWILNIQNFEFK